MKKIILSGFMGAGKSLIGKLLADKTSTQVYDLDYLIEIAEKLDIKSIFETKGELYFRRLEHQILKDLLKKKYCCIIILGGGTPCYFENFNLYENENSIYLKASIQTLYSRLVDETSNRPLLLKKSETNLKEFIAKSIFEREYYYNKSKFKIIVDDKSPVEIVDEIILKIKKT